jgi:hypothetical protein
MLNLVQAVFDSLLFILCVQHIISLCTAGTTLAR